VKPDVAHDKGPGLHSATLKDLESPGSPEFELYLATKDTVWDPDITVLAGIFI
jgi:hypothetical protein